MADTPTLGPFFYSVQTYRGALLNWHSLSTAQHVSKNNRSDGRDLPADERRGGGGEGSREWPPTAPAWLQAHCTLAKAKSGLRRLERRLPPKGLGFRGALGVSLGRGTEGGTRKW